MFWVYQCCFKISSLEITHHSYHLSFFTLGLNIACTIAPLPELSLIKVLGAVQYKANDNISLRKKMFALMFMLSISTKFHLILWNVRKHKIFWHTLRNCQQSCRWHAFYFWWTKTYKATCMFLWQMYLKSVCHDSPRKIPEKIAVIASSMLNLNLPFISPS